MKRRADLMTMSLENMELVQNAAEVMHDFLHDKESIFEFFGIVLDAVAWNKVKNGKVKAAQDVIDRDAALTRLHEDAIKLVEETSQLVEEK